MSNFVWAILPIALVLILYILIFTGKGEFTRLRKSWRRYDWITFFSAIFGCIILSSTMKASGIQFPAVPLLIATTLVIAAAITIALIRRARTGRPVIQTMGDERTEIVLAKSARNGFFATYMTLFVHLFVTDAGTLDSSWLLVMLTTGLVVLVASLPVYYYRKS
jgi:hypothetical protein